MKASKSTFYQPSGELGKFIRFYLDIELPGELFIKNPRVIYPTIFPALNIFVSDRLNRYRVGDTLYGDMRIFAGGLTRLPSEAVTFNDIRVISVFFYPNGFQHIFDMSIAPLANGFTSLDSFDHAGALYLQKNVVDCTDDAERIDHLDGYLMSKLKSSAWDNPVIDHTVGLVLERKANIRVEEIAATVGVPERTLRRHFSNQMGMSVKEFIDIGRINLASVMLTSNPDIKVQEIIQLLGYYDQSHFIRHLKKYVGVTGNGIEELRASFLSSYARIESDNPVNAS